MPETFVAVMNNAQWQDITGVMNVQETLVTMPNTEPNGASLLEPGMPPGGALYVGFVRSN